MDAVPTEDGSAVAFAATATVVAALAVGLAETKLALPTWPKLQKVVPAPTNVSCRQQRICMVTTTTVVVEPVCAVVMAHAVAAVR